MDKGFPQKKVLSLVLCVAVMLSVRVMGASCSLRTCHLSVRQLRIGLYAQNGRYGLRVRLSM